MMCNVGERPFCHMQTGMVQISVHICNSDLDILCLSSYTTVAVDSVSGQQRPRSACANVQADQGLCCPQFAERPFLCIVHRILWFSLEAPWRGTSFE